MSELNNIEYRSGEGADNSGTISRQEANFPVILVTRKQKTYDSFVRTLENFTITGRKIRVINAGDLNEAQHFLDELHETLLVIIDHHIQVNGSFRILNDYIENELNLKDCRVILRDELIKRTVRTDQFSTDEKGTAQQQLLELIRMIFLTLEMEEQLDEAEGYEVSKNQPAPKNETRELLYEQLARDIKGPVGNIKVLLEFLSNEPGLLNQESSIDLLQRIRASAESVHEMLEDYLFWSNLDLTGQEPRPTRVNVPMTLSENLLVLKKYIRDSKIRIDNKVDQDLNVYADEQMTHLVFRNLLYHAVKFSEPGSTLYIAATRGHRFHTIEISNHETAILLTSVREHPTLGNEYDLSSTYAETSRMVGIMMCQELLEQNGGALETEYDEDRGALLRIRLPVWPPVD
ncbi:MAG: hypothetical protein Kow00127_05670 [Bacteroidales bacterium]